MAWMNDKIIKIGNKRWRRIEENQSQRRWLYFYDESFRNRCDGNAEIHFRRRFRGMAFRKKPAEQSNYDKEVISVNERVQVFMDCFLGNISE